MSDNDRILVDRAKAGDNKAFELLVRKYQTRVAAVISRVVSDQEKVEDLTQEAFIKAYRALASFRGDAAFYTWLYRIAVNTAKNHLMSLGRMPIQADIDFEEADQIVAQLHHYDTPEYRMLRSEMLDLLRTAIDSLAPVMRRTIEMRELEGLSYEQIAEALDCPIGTVRSRIFRGRQEIADRMKDYLAAGWIR